MTVAMISPSDSAVPGTELSHCRRIAPSHAVPTLCVVPRRQLPGLESGAGGVTAAGRIAPTGGLHATSMSYRKPSARGLETMV